MQGQIRLGTEVPLEMYTRTVSLESLAARRKIGPADLTEDLRVIK